MQTWFMQTGASDNIMLGPHLALSSPLLIGPVMPPAGLDGISCNEREAFAGRAYLGNRKENEMKKPGMTTWAALAASVITCVLSGCGAGGSDGGGTVSALSMPDRIELTRVEDGSSAHARTTNPRNAIVSVYSDAGTDYALQTKQSWVEDTNALDTVNDVLVAVKDTGYQYYVNEGPYKALIRKVGDSGTSQSGSSQTSTTTEDLQELVADISRASAADPMIMKIWVEEPDGPGGVAMRIRGYFTVTRGVSDDYPFGAMEAHFKSNVINADGTEGAQVFTMAMKVDAVDGDVSIECCEIGSEPGGYTWDRRVRVLADPTLTSGNAYSYSREGMSGSETETTTNFAFNADYFKYQNVGDPSPTVLDKNAPYYKVFRYKLFDQETGTLVTRNSGFPISFTSGGETKNGYVGYYGLWTPSGTTLADGDTVTRMDNDVSYTLVKVGGKLTKHTRASILLGDLIGVEMSKFEGSTDYVVAWDGTQFEKIGERNPANGQIAYYEEGNHTATTFQEWEGAWCQALNAYLRLGTITTPANESTVYYHAEETIDPTQIASDMTLYYWGFALSAPIDQAAIDGAAAAQNAYWSGAPSEAQYTFDKETLTLQDGDGDPVLIGDSLDLSGSNFAYGYSMGPLTTESCATSADAFNAEIYYTWTTGQESWNQFAALKDGGENYVVFDKPLQFAYTHATANDLNGESTNDGKKFCLDYDGFSLQVPWQFSASRGTWIPAFSLVDGTAVGGSYVAKGVEEGVMLSEVDASLGSSLTLTELDPPTFTYDASKTALVGALPEDTEVKVIKGEVVE